jgi:hypothetical protein
MSVLLSDRVSPTIPSNWSGASDLPHSVTICFERVVFLTRRSGCEQGRGETSNFRRCDLLPGFKRNGKVVLTH